MKILTLFFSTLTLFGALVASATAQNVIFKMKRSPLNKLSIADL
ncbi:MAG TPA: hypothetical protein VHP32_01735 [Ignavibacteria bacterium]|nr:hypothetical protein [Ignavibacteria bacterium]